MAHDIAFVLYYLAARLLAAIIVFFYLVARLPATIIVFYLVARLLATNIFYMLTSTGNHHVQLYCLSASHDMDDNTLHDVLEIHRIVVCGLV